MALSMARGLAALGAPPPRPGLDVDVRDLSARWSNEVRKSTGQTSRSFDMDLREGSDLSVLEVQGTDRNPFVTQYWSD